MDILNGPGYWMNEQSGVLRPAVERYLQGETLSEPDIAALRAYIRQWIMNPAWDLNPHGTDGLPGLRDMVDSLTNRKQIDLWSERALDVCIDPW